MDHPFESVLFLGFPVSNSFQNELFKLSPIEREIFIINDNPLYLQQIEHEGSVYLGKYLDLPVEMRAIESSQSHIFSILKKMIPCFSYENTSLILLALPGSISS